MEVVIPHSLGKIEAKSRIEAGLPKLAAHIPGGGSLSSEWASDYSLRLVIVAMGQNIPVQLDIKDHQIRGDVSVPLFLKMMSGQISDFIKTSAQKMLANT